MTQSDIDQFLNSLGLITTEFDSDRKIVLYKTPDTDRIFAIIHDQTNPLIIEARCDTQLAKLLRTKYESVLPSHNMNSKSWNKIICSGQLTDDEIQDLLRLSHDLSLADNSV